ncbi:MAG: hypothetical protein V4691_01720 [Pseudomonadota bacterium]
MATDLSTKNPDARLSYYEKCTLVLHLAGIVVTVIGLIAIYATLSVSNKQMEQSIKQTKLTLHDKTLGYALELDRIFIENPDLRPYFYENRDITEKDPKFRRVLSIAEMHLDTFTFALKARSDYPIDHPFPAETEAWIHDVVKSSPIMQRYLQERKDWYSNLYKFIYP